MPARGPLGFFYPRLIVFTPSSDDELLAANKLLQPIHMFRAPKPSQPKLECSNVVEYPIEYVRRREGQRQSKGNVVVSSPC
ncbi:hypothetical protein CONPUDRAFT_137478 [Coniophora puteana RWD-64-598 SS2]|uniref:Uncharacterized protein n=1 Tax=Coniophora puteana (strain RWD-64-598) TaxID=741705 RepID=A0A5M3MLZ3_CONPW|nr:uncharacterized protein CONPUDRAFT_137478 [Coniophora puteana RWD-64-598 SS2]EIW80133.1 hypothetical protein CONPUDRAFT_137478 [Coniophora puteana RWD-64-598 SS2]